MPDRGEGAASESSRAQLAREVRRRAASLIHDASGTEGLGAAIYTLADPRDVRCPRYVGRTLAPRRRFAQHLHTARLWVPDEHPWWIKEERLRPLYAWLRELYADERRLPAMLVQAWVDPAAAAASERTLIVDCTRRGCSLLNVERRLGGPQLPLL